MALEAQKNMIIKGSPVAWMYKLTDSEGSASDALELTYRFDNLNTQPVAKFISAGNAAGGENIDIARADGGIWRIAKENLVLDLLTENQVIDSGGGADASGLGEITIVTNEAPIASTPFEGWTAFIADLIAKKDDKFLVIIPTGYSATRTGTGNSQKPDGYIYMIGKITNDIEVGSSVPSSLTITFAAQKASDFGVTSKTFTSVTDGIMIKRGGANYNIAADKTVPVALGSTDFAELIKGKIIIKANAA